MQGLWDCSWLVALPQNYQSISWVVTMGVCERPGSILKVGARGLWLPCLRADVRWNAGGVEVRTQLIWLETCRYKAIEFILIV